MSNIKELMKKILIFLRSIIPKSKKERFEDALGKFIYLYGHLPEIKGPEGPKGLPPLVETKRTEEIYDRTQYIYP
jgi:hypothetical protein